MDDSQLLRYNRHIMLPQVGFEGQQRLCDAHVLIIGLGGLGSPAAIYLAAAGVGHITLADDDRVEITNLQRQIAHRTADIGAAKVDSARNCLLALNPEIRIDCLSERLQGAALEQAVAAADVVLDATDNFTSRYAINAACVKQRTPLVSGAAIRFEGQLAVFDFADTESPCYHCLYPHSDASSEETCSENGILAPVVGTIGSMQALEAIKLICRIGERSSGRLMLFDALALEWRSLKFKRDPNCPVCS
jgi:molybdopterin/thiamine biosynthesis adenylyltransferase